MELNRKTLNKLLNQVIPAFSNYLYLFNVTNIND
jgi:hypothetical protein